MTTQKSRTGRSMLKMALLGSAALFASGCSADMSYQNLSNRLDQQQNVQTVDPYKLGKKQYANGLYGMALKNFRIALVRDPKSIDKLNAVAATYDKLGRFDLSERYYARALAVDPKSVLTLNNVGYSFLIQKDYVSARYYLEQAATVAAGNSKYNDTVGANLVSLDMAESRTVAQLQRPIEPRTTNVSIETGSRLQEEIAVNKQDGQVHNIATYQDVAKVAAAGTAPESAGGDESADARQDEIVLVPAALPLPPVEAAPVGLVEAEVLEEPAPITEAAPAALPEAKVAAAPIALTETETVAAPAEKPKVKKLIAPDEAFIELSNGNGRRHMASRTRAFLNNNGVSVGRLTNAQNFSFATSTLFYREGHAERAREIAGLFPMPIELKQVDKQRADIRVLFGADALEFDSRRLAANTGS